MADGDLDDSGASPFTGSLIESADMPSFGDDVSSLDDLFLFLRNDTMIFIRVAILLLDSIL